MIKKEHRKKLALFVFIGAWFVFFYLLWRDMLVFDANGLRIGWLGIWGDWAAHFTQGSAFAYRSLWIKENPLLVGAPFSYPFAVNFISGLLVRFGMNFFSAFIIPSYFYCLLFVFVLVVFYLLVFRSKSIAILASSIFLLNGGLGFWWYLREVVEKGVLFWPDKEYTHLSDQGIQWISVITSMMVPQRAFVFGFPIALLIFLMIFLQIQQQRHEWKVSRFLGAGLLYGFMPLIHTHSFLVLGIIFACWFVYSMMRKEHDKHSVVHALLCWTIFGVVTLTIASPILLTFYRGTVSDTAHGNFIRWYPGWYVNKNAEHAGMNWMWWWLLNWGITLPLGIAGLFAMPRKQAIVLAPFFVIFVLLNLFLFQPFAWDNTKFLVWASLGISGCAGYALWVFMKAKGKVFFPLAMLLFFFAIFSGGLDALYALDKSKHSWTMYSNDDLSMVEFVRQRTDPNEVFLTSDSHNNPIINLTGRKILMGFRGWLWTYGMNYGPVERDVMAIYYANKDIDELLKKYNISYVVFDGKVLSEYRADEKYFRNRFPIFYENLWHRIYKVKP